MADKPEDEYFARIDREQKAKLAELANAEAAKKAKDEAKARHWHKCGKCGADMASHAFRGIEIEVCGGCGAVLLDPGELETLAGSDKSGILGGLKGLFGR